jgi:hypothetical protein
MPVPGAGETIAVSSIRLRGGTGKIRQSHVWVGLVVNMGAVSDQVASITVKAWEVKPNEYVPGLVSVTFTFDSEPDFTVWVPPDDIEWAQQL